MTQEELDKIVEQHQHWLHKDVDGCRWEICMSELKYYKLFHRTSALTSPQFISVVEFGNGDEVYLKSEADEVIARHKYKRCLANAEICCEKKENCYNRALRKYNKDEADYLVRKSDFWQDWEFRWLELAEKFKETK